MHFVGRRSVVPGRLASPGRAKARRDRGRALLLERCGAHGWILDERARQKTRWPERRRHCTCQPVRLIGYLCIGVGRKADWVLLNFCMLAWCMCIACALRVRSGRCAGGRVTSPWCDLRRGQRRMRAGPLRPCRTRWCPLQLCSNAMSLEGRVGDARTKVPSSRRSILLLRPRVSGHQRHGVSFPHVRPGAVFSYWAVRFRTRCVHMRHGHGHGHGRLRHVHLVRSRKCVARRRSRSLYVGRSPVRQRCQCGSGDWGPAPRYSCKALHLLVRKDSLVADVWCGCGLADRTFAAPRRPERGGGGDTHGQHSISNLESRRSSAVQSRLSVLGPGGRRL